MAVAPATVWAHDGGHTGRGLSEAARQAGPSPAGVGSIQSRSGWFHVIYGDAPSAAGVPAVFGYALIDEQGQATELLVDDQVLHGLGGPRAINHRRVLVVGRDAAPLPSGVQGALPIFAVQSLQLDSAQAAAAAPAQPVSGPQPWATILCRFSDSTGVTPHPPSWFQALVLGTTPPGLDHFWRELSYNNVNLTGGEVHGWFNLPQPRSYYVYGNPLQLDFGRAANDCTAVADAEINFQNFVGINLMFNTDLDGYAWGGSWTLTRDGVTKNFRTTWVPPWGYNNQGPIAHEMGHGFGLPHSSGPYDKTYDSRWDVMSDIWDNCPPIDATYGCVGVHTIAYHKDFLGWIPSGQKYVATPGTSQTILMERHAQPTTSNYLIAQLPIVGTSTQFYTVEVRRFAGYDVKVPGEAVVLHKVDTTRGNRVAQVVDTDANGNPNDAGAMWLPGESFVDAANGLTVAVNAQVGNGFQLTITNSNGGNGLTVAKAGNGSGTVTSGDGKINCGSTCTASVASGTQVSLTAAPAANSTFAGWSGGGCSGTGGCAVTVTSAVTVTATFTLKTFPLTVVRAGTGSGTVTSGDGAINCGSTCSETVATGTPVTLTAAAAANSTFAGWSGGGCSGTGSCMVTVTSATTVTATFTLKNVTLTVTKLGSGTGTVTSGDGKINCGAMCSATYTTGTAVSLAAVAGVGATFKQWGGVCSGATCTITLNADQSVTATFSEIFTDGSGPNFVISSGATVIKATHILELRTAINNLRAVNNLTAYAWADPTLTVHSTVAKRVHFLDLRAALSAVCTALPGRCTPYTDATITSGQTVIRAVHLDELRANVRALE